MKQNQLVRLLKRQITKNIRENKVTAVPVVEDPTLQTWIKQVSTQIAESDSKYTRKEDLKNAGVISIQNGVVQPPITEGDSPSNVVLPAVTELYAGGAYTSVTLTWEQTESKHFGLNEIFRSEINDFGVAIKIGTTTAKVYTDYVGNDAKVYYWVRPVNKSGIIGLLAPSVYAETALSFEFIKDTIIGKIEESWINQEFNNVLNGMKESIVNGVELINSVKTTLTNSIEQLEVRSNNAIEQAKALLSQSITNEIDKTNTLIDTKTAELKNADIAQASTTNKLAVQMRGGYDGNDLDQVSSGLLYQHKRSTTTAIETLTEQMSLISATGNNGFDSGVIYFFDDGAESWVDTLGNAPDLTLGWLKLANKASSWMLTSSSFDHTLPVSKYSEIRLRIRRIGIPEQDLVVSVHDDLGTVQSRVIEQDLYVFDAMDITTISIQPIWTVQNLSKISISRASESTYDSENYYEIDWIAIGRPSPSASFSSVSEEIIARVKGDEVNNSKIESYYAELKNNDNNTNARIDTETSTRVTNEEATTKRITNAETKINDNKSSIQTVQTNVTDLEKSTATMIDNVTSSFKADLKQTNENLSDTDLIARAMTSGKLLYGDPTFKQGVNGVSYYDNFSTGRVHVERIAKEADNPTTSGYQLNVTVANGANPYYGGFLQYINSRPNAVFLCKFIAKLPIGYKFMPFANAQGTGASDKFLGNAQGTDKYETYYRLVRCGASGSFGTGGHVGVGSVDDLMLTGAATMTFPLASIECYDITDFADMTPAVSEKFANVSESINTLTNADQATASKIIQLQANFNISSPNMRMPTSIVESKTNIWTGFSTEMPSNFVYGTDLPTYAMLNKGAIRWSGERISGTGYGFGTYTMESTGLGMFRCFVYVAKAKTISFTNAAIYDAAAFYVNEVLQYSQKNFNSAYNDMKLTLVAGWNKIDALIANTSGAGGFTLTPAIETLVDKMCATNYVDILHNTGASILSTYITKEESNSSIAGKFEEFSTTVSNQVKADLTTMKEATFDTRHWSFGRDTWYPVVFRLNNRNRKHIEILSKLYQHPSDAYWITHNTKTFSCQYIWEVNASEWGANPVDRQILSAEFLWVSNFQPVIGIGQHSPDSLEVAFVRGGGVYTVRCSKEIDVIFVGDDGFFAPNSNLTIQKILYNKNLAIFADKAILSTKITETTQVVDGIKGIKSVFIDNNGVASGYATTSELINGQVRSTFGVYANTFFVADPANPNSKAYPLIVYNGKVVMDGAIIRDASITNAKIGDISADKITAGNIAAARMKAGIVEAATGQFSTLSALSARIGFFKSGDGNQRVEISNNGIRVFDANGVARIEIGDF